MRKGTEKILSLINKQRELFARTKDELINNSEQSELYIEKLSAAYTLLRNIKFELENAGLTTHPYFSNIVNQINAELLQTNGENFEKTFSNETNLNNSNNELSK